MKIFDPLATLQGMEMTEDSVRRLPKEFLTEKTILGLDIYRYSQFESVQQIFIPIIFDLLYESTVKEIIKQETYFFQKYGLDIKSFKTRFISTGDGGFQIVDNPIQALIFAMYFQGNIKAFNSGRIKSFEFQNLHLVVPSLDIRFAITRGDIFSYKLNYYGEPIINNARLLSKDRLNRVLMDEFAINWFVSNIDTPESLLIYDMIAFNKLSYFQYYNDYQHRSELFNDFSAIRKIDFMKIGDITSKKTELTAYNVYIQFRLLYAWDKIEKKQKGIMITLGNLNISGIYD